MENDERRMFNGEIQMRKESGRLLLRHLTPTALEVDHSSFIRPWSFSLVSFRVFSRERKIAARELARMKITEQSQATKVSF
jgi:hypothetical protein